MDPQQSSENLLEFCPPWLDLGPDADWLETCTRASEHASSKPLQAATEASDLSADTQDPSLWTLAVVDSHADKALRSVTPAEPRAVWVPQPLVQACCIAREESQPLPVASEPPPEPAPSEGGSSPPSPGLAPRGSGSLERQTSVASQLSKIGGPCQHCGVKESPQWRRGPANKPILCNACGTRYRRTHQFKHALDGLPEGLPRTSSISSSQSLAMPKASSLESPGSMGTRSSSLTTRSSSLGTRNSQNQSPGSLAGRLRERSAAGGRNRRKRAIGDVTPDDEFA